MACWYMNGIAVDTVPIADRGFQYADGLFETIAVRDARARLLDKHLDRLRTGCRRLGINVCQRDELTALVNSVISQQEFADGRGLLKMIVTRGVGERGYAPPEQHTANVYLGAFAAPLIPASHYDPGIAVRVCQTRLAHQPLMAGMKTLARLEQVLARAEWRDPAIAEGLMLDQQDALVCGTMSNVFIVTGGELHSPDLALCGVNGVMRRQVLELADELDLRCEIGRISVAMLKSADEVFICNSQSAVRPVSACGGHTWQPGRVTRRLIAALRECGVVEGTA